MTYDPADPDDARVDSFRLLYLTSIFAVISLGLTTFAVVLLAGARKRRKMIAYLRRHGRERGMGGTSRDRCRRPGEISRRPLYYVRAVWNDPDTGRTHAAESDRLRTDPGPSLRGQEYVRVLYDPEEPNRNVVDVDTTNPV